MEHVSTSVHSIVSNKATFTFNNMDADELRECIARGLRMINSSLRIKWDREGLYAAVYLNATGNDYVHIEVSDPADWFFNIAEAVQILLHTSRVTVDLNMFLPSDNDICKFTVSWTYETNQGEVPTTTQSPGAASAHRMAE